MDNFITGNLFLKGAIFKNGMCTPKNGMPFYLFKMGIPLLELPPREWSKNWFTVMCPPKKLKKSEPGVYISMSCIIKSSLCFLGKVLEAKCTKSKWSYMAFCYQISKKTIEIARFLMLRFQCITKNIPRRMLFKCWW